MAVGNPLLSQTHLFNSIIGVKYHHGFIDKSQWDSLRACCPDIAAYQDLARCDFSKFINLESSSYGHLVPVNDSVCATTIAAIATPFENTNNNFNIYQDCYENTDTNLFTQTTEKRDARNQFQRVSMVRRDGYNTFSTDALGGFPCFEVSTTENYLNNQDVRAALHIPSYVQDFAMCRIEIESHYTTEITDMSPIFDAIIASGYQLKMLIYSGDVDFVCNPIGTQWLWKKQQIGGYSKLFQGNAASIHLLTVKGAGHFASMDRPGPALQMIANFWLIQITNEFKVKEQLTSIKAAVKPSAQHSASSKNLNTKTAFKDTASDSKVNLLKAPPTQTKEQDLITELPGLTFSMPPQYSGYLNATKGVFLHYWLITSQGSNPSTDPLILWLNGGPGCSSLGGLFTTLGPFKPSADGTQLVENVFGWTKVGHVLYLETPRGVGFSYSTDESDIPADQPYNDTITAENTVQALKSFFAKFQSITIDRFTLLESPMLTMKSDNIHYINLAGAAIGNGLMNLYNQINSAVQLGYYRGFYDLPTLKILRNVVNLLNPSVILLST
uniref:Serine carboxypeptidase n=1 Tax=Ditylenchus dipsaci TaxID=166011 RepID=A0A915E4Q7_9BILA